MRASLSAHDLFRRALGDNLATTVPALRTHGYDPVRLRDDIEIVLNDDDRVARVHQPMQDPNQFLYIGHVQPDGRLIQHVQRVAGCEVQALQTRPCL